MSPDPTAQIAALGIEPTYSAREAARLLGRSYSWLDQRLRAGQFVVPDGTTVQPLRTSGRYRRFTIAVLRDVATSSYRQRRMRLTGPRELVHGKRESSTGTAVSLAG